MDVNDIIQNQEQKWGEERIDEDTMVKKPKDLHELGVLLGLEEESEDERFAREAEWDELLEKEN